MGEKTELDHEALSKMLMTELRDALEASRLSRDQRIRVERYAKQVQFFERELERTEDPDERERIRRRLELAHAVLRQLAFLDEAKSEKAAAAFLARVREVGTELVAEVAAAAAKSTLKSLRGD